MHLLWLFEVRVRVVNVNFDALMFSLFLFIPLPGRSEAENRDLDPLP